MTQSPDSGPGDQDPPTVSEPNTGGIEQDRWAQEEEQSRNSGWSAWKDSDPLQDGQVRGMKSPQCTIEMALAGSSHQEKLFDCCYIITSDVSQSHMTHEEVVAAYKNLSVVEQAFRNLKTVSLENRPVYHKKDDQIRSHVFLCMHAFYLQCYMQQRLKPLFEADGS